MPGVLPIPNTRAGEARRLPHLNALAVLCVSVLLLGAVAGQTASAHSISFSDLGYGSELDLLLYDSSGNFIAQYNSTSAGVPLDPNLSYVCVIQPNQERRFWDPVTLVYDVTAFVENYWVILMFGAIAVALALSPLRRH